MIKASREDVMERLNVRSSSALLAMLLAVVVLSGDRMAAAQQQSAIQRKVLLQQDLNFPNLQMVTTLVEIPVGVSEVRHTHPGVLGIYVLEGTLTLVHEGRPTTTYKAGESAHIDAGKIHQGINAGSATVKLVATVVAEKGKPLNTPVP
jgi:quercetin dioxygenase-like cupin family protein